MDFENDERPDLRWHQPPDDVPEGHVEPEGEPWPSPGIDPNERTVDWSHDRCPAGDGPLYGADADLCVNSCLFAVLEPRWGTDGIGPLRRTRALIQTLVRAGQAIAINGGRGPEAAAAIALVDRLTARSVNGSGDKPLRTELHRAVEAAAKMIRNGKRPVDYPGPHPALEPFFMQWPDVWYRMSDSVFVAAAEAAAKAESGKTDPRWPLMAILFESAGLGIIEPGAIESENKRLRKEGKL
jgi:hypothetical protein